jgi:GNAT superfamily N-acetyltransferase
MPTFTQATPTDRDLLLPMMRDFYAHESLPFTPAVIAAVENLLQNPTLGHIYLLHEPPALYGYFVLTFGYSLERAGRTALLDELYILPAARRKGLATAALDFAAQLARSLHCHALHLEVDHANTPAHTLYTRSGFLTHNRHYLTLPLKD